MYRRYINIIYPEKLNEIKCATVINKITRISSGAQPGKADSERTWN